MSTVKLTGNRIGKALVIALLAFIQVPSPVFPLVIDDGGIHTIDYDLNENVLVYDSSVVNLEGEIYGALNAYDSSVINVLSGGHPMYLNIYDNATVSMSGGDVGETMGLGGNATLYWSDGGTDAFYMSGGRLEMTGFTTGANFFYVYGGTAIISDAYLGGPIGIYGNAEAIINDGVFGGDKYFHGQSNVQIYGGTWDNTSEFTIDDSSSVTVYGYGFNIPYGTYTAADNLEYVSGFFWDGSPFEVAPSSQSWNMLGDQGRLILVPEPATVVLLGIGVISLLCMRKRKSTKVQACF